MVTDAQVCNYIKRQLIVYFKWINCLGYEFYFNKTIYKESDLDGDINHQRALSELAMIVFSPQSGKSLRRNWADWETANSGELQNRSGHYQRECLEMKTVEKERNHDPPS